MTSNAARKQRPSRQGFSSRRGCGECEGYGTTVPTAVGLASEAALHGVATAIRINPGASAVRIFSAFFALFVLFRGY
jgi:hypothetical protein